MTFDLPLVRCVLGVYKSTPDNDCGRYLTTLALPVLRDVIVEQMVSDIIKANPDKYFVKSVTPVLFPDDCDNQCLSCPIFEACDNEARLFIYPKKR